MLALHFRRRRRTALLTLALLPVGLLLASCQTTSGTENYNPGSGSGPDTNAPAGSGGGIAPAPPAGSTSGAAFEKPRKPDGDILIKIVTNGISPFWDPMAVGMKKAAEEVGCQADWSGPENATVAEQRRIVEDALARGADGLALSCIEAEAARPLIDMALEKGVPVITFDADSPGSRRLCYIGTNNFNAGKAAGEAAGKLLPGGQKFVGFVGNLTAQNARERADGFKAAAGTYKIELLEVLDDNKSASRARNNVESTISKHGEQIQGLLGLFSYNGPAIAQAVSNAGLRARYKIVCFDAEPVTLNELEKGNIDATIVQKPYDFGYLSTKLLYLINRKGWSEAKKEMRIPDDGIYDTGVETITPQNVREYRQRLTALGIKSS